MARFSDLTAAQKRSALKGGTGGTIPAVDSFSAAAGNVADQAIVEMSEALGALGGQSLHQAVAVADAGAITAYAAVENMTNPVTKAEGEAVSAALHTLQTEVTALRTTLNGLLASLRTSNLLDT